MNTLDVKELLTIARLKGVELWLEEGTVRYRAPEGALDAEDLHQLRKYRSEIAEKLVEDRQSHSPPPELKRREQSESIPLTFSQTSHWRLHRLWERKSRRHVASAIHIFGPLHPELLNEAVGVLMNRHESLRTRIACDNGSPVQTVIDTLSVDVQIADLAAIPRSVIPDATSVEIDRFISSPVDVYKDNLLGIKVLKVSRDEFILVLALEHIISDAYSLGVFRRELLQTYAKMRSNISPSLAPVPIQFADYAVWQRKNAANIASGFQQYYNDRILPLGRARFPDRGQSITGAVDGWSSVSLEFSQEMKSKLAAWARRRKSTVALGAFTAFAALVSRWCNVDEFVLQFEVNGRFSEKLDNTIGYFASPLFIPLRVREDDTFDMLAERVMADYCVAHDKFDQSYFLAQSPPPAFAQSAGFNWIPEFESDGRAEQLREGADIECRPFPFTISAAEDTKWDNEPILVLADSSQVTVGTIFYDSGKLTRVSMVAFAERYVDFVRALSMGSAERIPAEKGEVRH